MPGHQSKDKAGPQGPPPSGGSSVRGPTPKPGQLLEAFADAWQNQAEQLLAFARRQDAELAALREALARANDRADYWHARAVAAAPTLGEIAAAAEAPRRRARAE